MEQVHAAIAPLIESCPWGREGQRMSKLSLRQDYNPHYDGRCCQQSQYIVSAISIT
jgi:hypothetical protein